MIAERNAGKIYAIHKCVIVYNRYAIRNPYTCNILARRKSCTTYARHRQTIVCRRYHNVIIFTGAYINTITLFVRIQIKAQPFAGFDLFSAHRADIIHIIMCNHGLLVILVSASAGTSMFRIALVCARWRSNLSRIVMRMFLCNISGYLVNSAVNLHIDCLAV